MLTLSTDVKIYIAKIAVDMRKSIDGLCLSVLEQFNCNPQDDGVFLFHNKKGDKVKILYWEKNGFCMLYKRLEKLRFKFPRHYPDDEYIVDEKQLRWLLSGFEFARMAEHDECDFTDYH